MGTSRKAPDAVTETAEQTSATAEQIAGVVEALDLDGSPDGDERAARVAEHADAARERVARTAEHADRAVERASQARDEAEHAASDEGRAAHLREADLHEAAAVAQRAAAEAMARHAEVDDDLARRLSGPSAEP
jgi:hypothetical protein